MPPPQRKRLGEVLLEAGVIDATQLNAALGHQRRWGGRIGQALIDLKMATEEQIVSTLAAKLGFRRMQLESLEFGPSLELALRLVPHDFAERNQLLAYAADATTIWVAMADPTNVGVVDELAFRTGRNVKLSIAGDGEVVRAVQRLYLGERQQVEAIALDDIDDAPVEMVGNLHQEFTPAAATAERKLAEAAREVRAPAAPAPPPPPPPPRTAVAVRLEALLREVERSPGDPGITPELARLSHFTAAVARLLVRKGLLTEQELAAAYEEAERGAPRR